MRAHMRVCSHGHHPLVLPRPSRPHILTISPRLRSSITALRSPVRCAAMASDGESSGDPDDDLEYDFDPEEDTEEYQPTIDLNSLSTTPILSVEEVADRMFDTVHDEAKLYFKSFYSSVYGGIVTDPALFMLPMDDHLVHRGHGVFDTALMAGGNIYQLDAHLDRFFRSADAARIPYAASYDSIRRKILDTAAASRCPNGFLRYWMSAGRGGFSLSGHDTMRSEFYCVCYNGPHPDMDETAGWRVKTTQVPNKPAYFAELKSVNYLQNALNLMDAQDAGLELGVFINADGTIAEGPNLNIGIITNEGVVKVAPFSGALAGCTMTRILELVPGFAQQGLLEDIVGIVQGPIQLEEAYLAQEVFVAGGSIPVAPIVQWDGRDIADGKVGVGALVLRNMIINDMKTTPAGNDQLTPVPYGLTSGMIDDVFS